MKKLFLLLLFIPIVSFGQDYGNNADAMKLCSFVQTNNFGTDAEAERGLDRILSAIGASKRFVLMPCEAGTYYYQCSAHSGMVGTITIE